MIQDDLLVSWSGFNFLLIIYQNHIKKSQIIKIIVLNFIIFLAFLLTNEQYRVEDPFPIILYSFV